MKNRSVSDFVAASMDAVLKSAEHRALFNTQYKFANKKDTMCSEHGKMDSCSADDSEKDSNSADFNDPLNPDLYGGPKEEFDPHFFAKHPGGSAPNVNVPHLTDTTPGPKTDSKGMPLPYGDRSWLEGQQINNTREYATGGKFKAPLAPRPSGQNADDASADDNDAKKKKFNFEKKKDKDSSSSSSDSSSAEDSDTMEAFDNDYAKDEEMKSSTAYNTAITSLLTASAALDYIGLGRSSALSLKLASLVTEAKAKKKEKKESKSDSNSAKDKEKAAKEKEKAKAAKEKELAAEKKEKEKEKAKAAKEKEDAAKAKAKEKAAKDKAKSSSK